MVMIECKHCGGSVSGEVSACPHCGAPQRQPAPPLPVQTPPAIQQRPGGSEETIYSDNAVTVTTTRVVVAGATYALRNIASVRTTFTPPQIGGAILVLLGGVFILLLALIFTSGHSSPIPGYVMAGALIIGSVGWMCTRKTQYHVVISSASGEVHALTSKDKAYINAVVQSINEAIVKCR